MILAISLFLVTICSVSSLLMVRTVLDHQRINTRKREIFRAYCIAESGVALVQHWGNHPDDFTFDPDLFTYVPPSSSGGGTETADAGVSGGGATTSSAGAATSASGGGTIPISVVNGSIQQQYPNLYAALIAGGGKITISPAMMKQLSVGRFQTSKGNGAGRIKRIDLLLPGVLGVQAVPSGSALVPELIVRCVGQSESGLERTNISMMEMNPFLEIKLPAALISLAAASAFGNARIHWGESWSKSTFSMPSMSQMDYIAYGDPDRDIWSVYRTEATIKFPSSWQWKNEGPWSQPDRLYYQNGTTGVSESPEPGKFPDGTGNYRDAFIQNIPAGTLQWPNFALYYQDFKDFAIAHGRYFTTNAAGKIINGNGQEVAFDAEFGAENRDALPHDYVFIDTIDQNPPNGAGSNLSTITLTGSQAAAGIKGVFYICANFNAGGTGNPPNLGVAERPDGANVSLEKIFLDGVLYAAGTLAMSGNNGVYGCVVAERGFVGGGTPNVYYNHHLKGGLILANGNLGSRLKVILQSNYGEQTDAGGNPVG